jgi:hypothetical protein
LTLLVRETKSTELFLGYFWSVADAEKSAGSLAGPVCFLCGLCASTEGADVTEPTPYDPIGQPDWRDGIVAAESAHMNAAEDRSNLINNNGFVGEVWDLPQERGYVSGLHRNTPNNSSVR